MEINKPRVVAELDAAFDAYEQALIRNEIATLDHYFWTAHETVRYGVAENLYGADAIRDYRRQCAPVHPERRIRHKVSTTFGDDFGTVSIEFSAPDHPGVGRQMQTWARFPEGWRIVAAHVSMQL